MLNADSDLIFRRDWRSETLRLIDQTDGILSLFNTPNHVIIKESGEILEKKDIGAAGVFFTKDIVKRIVSALRQDTSKHKFTLDWVWSAILRKNKIRIMTVKNSLVQHIGIEGLWSRREWFDYGDGFIVDEINGQILNQMIKNLSNTIDVHLYRANLYYQYELYERAIMESSEVVRKAPHMPEGWFNVGCEAAALGRFKEAEMYIKRACELAPDNDFFKKNYEKLINHME